MLRNLSLIILIIILSACHTLDDDRVPFAPVRIPFSTQAMWEIYGVSGALDVKSFILSEGIPSNFPYTSLTYTGFGGVLLCCDIHGIALAYDLACPVERNRNVKVEVDVTKASAYCPHCGSVYDIFSNQGAPIDGEAARLGYGMKRYTVNSGANGEYKVIVN